LITSYRYVLYISVTASSIPSCSKVLLSRIPPVHFASRMVRNVEKRNADVTSAKDSRPDNEASFSHIPNIEANWHATLQASETWRRTCNKEIKFFSLQIWDPQTLLLYKIAITLLLSLLQRIK